MHVLFKNCKGMYMYYQSLNVLYKINNCLRTDKLSTFQIKSALANQTVIFTTYSHLGSKFILNKTVSHQYLL